jgi:hypothetical protein
LRVIFEEGNPFGALGFMPATNGQPSDTQGSTNDQDDIKRIKDNIPFKMEEDSPSSVGSIARDAIQTLKAAKDKASAVAPEIPGKLY